MHITFSKHKTAFLLSSILFLLHSDQLNTSAAKPDELSNYFETSKFKPVFNVSPVIEEVSASILDPSGDIVWTLGDSGTGPIIGRTILGRNSTTAICITGAHNFDWEAMVMDGNGYLWILDIGDNHAVRDHVRLYQVDPGVFSPGKDLPAIRTITVSYPCGTINAEAAAYCTNRIYIIEKTRRNEVRNARLFSVDISPDAGSEQIAEQEGQINIYHQITDASVSPEGHLYLLTYSGIYICENWPATSRIVSPVKFFSLGQQEAVIALGNNCFLVGVESGCFYSVIEYMPQLPLTDTRPEYSRELSR